MKSVTRCLECAALVKQGKVYGVGTEDMDVSGTPTPCHFYESLVFQALTFGADVLVRHLTFSEARSVIHPGNSGDSIMLCSPSRKMPIREYSLNKVLQSLGVNFDEVHRFVFCCSNHSSCRSFSSPICAFYSAVIIVIRSKVSDRSELWIWSNNIATSKQFSSISIQKSVSERHLALSQTKISICRRYRNTRYPAIGPMNRPGSYSKSLKCYRRMRLMSVFIFSRGFSQVSIIYLSWNGLNRMKKDSLHTWWLKRDSRKWKGFS